jgi:hypothetical protein
LDTNNLLSYLRVVTAIQDQLTKAGIKVKVAISDEPAWLKKVTGGTARLSLFLPSLAPDADTILPNFSTVRASRRTTIYRATASSIERLKKQGGIESN